MVEQQSKRVQDYTAEMVEELDRSHMRKIQGHMHKCAATCYDNDSYSIQRLHQCVQNCESTHHKAQEYVEGELKRILNRLQRCVMDCNDKIKDKMGPNPSQSEVDRYSGDFEGCASECVDNYCNVLHTLGPTMKKTLSDIEKLQA